MAGMRDIASFSGAGVSVHRQGMDFTMKPKKNTPKKPTPAVNEYEAAMALVRADVAKGRK